MTADLAAISKVIRNARGELRAPSGMQGDRRAQYINAAKLTLSLRRHLERLALEVREIARLAREAYESQAWRTLGYDTWPDYLAAEFAPDLMPRIPRDELEPLVRELNGSMSTRAISPLLGISQSTAARLSRSGESDDSPDRITGTDGKSYAARLVTASKIGPPATSTPSQMRASIARLDRALAIAKGKTGPRPESAQPRTVHVDIITPDIDIIEPEPEPEQTAREVVVAELSAEQCRDALLYVAEHDPKLFADAMVHVWEDEAAVSS